MRWILALLFVTVVAPALARAQATPSDFDVRVSASGGVTIATGDAPFIESVNQTPDAFSSFNVTKTWDVAHGAITFDGFFNVSAARQVLPKVDGRFFVEFFSTDLSSANPEGLFVNLTGTPRERRYFFTCPTVYVPKWKTEAASAASASPSVSASLKCSSRPAPPEAMTGMRTARLTARVSPMS